MCISFSINRRHFIILFAIHFSSLCLAQKEDYIWLGGYDFDNDSLDANVVEGYRFDFNKKPFGVENNISWKYGILGNNSSISDKNGNLLVFTNGCTIYNKYYQIMPNGDSINAGEWYDKLWKQCSKGYPGTQDVLILPDPREKDGYYLIHKPNIYNSPNPTYRRLDYSYIDMSLDNGNGDVTLKNQSFYDKSVQFSYLTAIKHQNKKDWWILQPLVNDSVFLTFLLDENGIRRMPDQNTHQFLDYERSIGAGTTRISPDGSKFALYNYYD